MNFLLGNFAASSLKKSRWYMIKSNPSSPLTTQCESHKVSTHLVRPSASYSTQASEQNPKEVSNSLSVLLFKLFNILFLLFFILCEYNFHQCCWPCYCGLSSTIHDTIKHATSVSICMHTCVILSRLLFMSYNQNCQESCLRELLDQLLTNVWASSQ